MKIFIKYSLLLFAIANTVNLSAMHSDRFKHFFSKGCTGIYWAVQAGPFAAVAAIQAAAYRRSQNTDNHLYHPPVSDEVAEFARKQLAAVGVKNSDAVSIRRMPALNKVEPIPACAKGLGDKLLVLGNADLLDRALEELPTLTTRSEQHTLTLEEQLRFEGWPIVVNDFAYAIQEQGIRMKNQDDRNLIIATAASPFATHYALKGLNVLAHRQPRAVGPRSIAASLLKIPSGIAMAAVNTVVGCAVAQHMVHRTDRAIPNTKSTLEGGINVNMQRHFLISSHVSKLLPPPAHPTPTQQKIYQLKQSAVYTALKPDNPPADLRAVAFKHRLATLEKQNK